MEIKMRKVIDGQQGYWSEIKLEHVDEQFIEHPLYGRVRLTNCAETETRCGFGEGCFTVTCESITAQASWMGNHVRGIYPNSLKRALTVGALIFFCFCDYL